MITNWTEEQGAEYLATIPTQWVLDHVNAVNNGAVDPLLSYITLYALEKAVKNAMETIKESAMNEAEKHPKSFQFHFAEIQRKSSSGVWNFKNIPEWNEAKETISKVETKYKDAFLQWQKGNSMVDSDGVQIEANQVEFTPGRETLAIKLL